MKLSKHGEFYCFNTQFKADLCFEVFGRKENIHILMKDATITLPLFVR